MAAIIDIHCVVHAALGTANYDRDEIIIQYSTD